MTGSTARHDILFVDDDPEILAGLKNLLFKQRARWNMTFASGGEVALTHLRSRAFDIVVSDMRMPGMDGATLLNQIKAEFPETARIMLSGQADRESLVRVLPVVHQLISKPCERDVLYASLEQCLGHGLPPRIRALIGNIERLPTSAEIHRAFLAALEAPASVKEISSIISNDPGLAMKVLQLACSRFFATRAVSSIEDAVGLLGTRRLRDLALSSSVFQPLDGGTAAQTFSALRDVSCEIARRVRREVSGPEQSEAFAVGLLHRVGHLALALALPDECQALEPGVIDLAHERSLFGTTHAAVGAALVELWGLPARMAEAIRFQHDPESAPLRSQPIARALFGATRPTGEPRAVA